MAAWGAFEMAPPQIKRMPFSEARPMSTVRIRSAFRVSLCLLLAGLLAPFCVTGEVTGQIKSNLSSSVTSESMIAVWVAREREWAMCWAGVAGGR